MIEIEVQNETHQTQDRMRFSAVPRIGEGIRLREPDGVWASYDVIDVWYQKAEFGDVWMPYLHICMTAGEGEFDAGAHAESVPENPQTSPQEEPVPSPLVDQFDEHGEAVGAYDHEDAAHDLGTEHEFASLTAGAEPFKI